MDSLIVSMLSLSLNIALIISLANTSHTINIDSKIDSVNKLKSNCEYKIDNAHVFVEASCDKYKIGDKVFKENK